MSPPSDPRPDVRQRIEAALAKRSSPTRAQHRRWGAVALAFALASPLAAIATRGIHAGGRPYGYVGIIAIGWCALVVAASSWTLRPGPTALGRPRPRLLLLAFGLPSSLLAVSCAASILFPETLRAPDYGSAVHLACAATATVFSLAPVGIALWFFRRSDPVRPAVTGAALGAIAASWSGAVIAVQCPHPEPLHVALAHVAPIALAAIVTSLVGARVLSLRRTR
jgi:hypothetical protein